MAADAPQKLPLIVLTDTVAGSMVGGIFSLLRIIGTATGPFGAVLAWIITAGGMYMLAHDFHTLGGKQSEINSRVLPQPCSCLGSPATGKSTDAR